MPAFFIQTIALLAAVSSVTASCGYNTHLHPRSANTVPVATFGYNGVIGPVNWHKLDPVNALCNTGKNQTPVDVVTSDSKVISGAGFQLNIPAVASAEFENLGSTVEVIINGTFVHGGTTYNIKQFHFHTPSEHRIDNKFAVMEVHFVSQTAAGAISVAGFPIQIGRNNNFLSNTFRNLEKIATPGTITTTGPLNFASITKHLTTNSVYRYGGSLTTPPCTEGVEWVFSTVPLSIDAGTFRRVQEVVKFNSRFLQNKIGETNLLSL